MFESLEQIPLQELQWRWSRCRKILQEQVPQAEGILVFSRVQIYWLSGHLGSGMFWLPLEGEPVLLVRKGLERAQLESALEQIHSFRSFGDLPTVLSKIGASLPAVTAVEMTGLSWALGRNLSERLPGVELLPGDQVLTQARLVKSDWELRKLSLAGRRQARVLEELLPQKIAPGSSELDLSWQVWQVCAEQGHQGQIRMAGAGEELFMGAISAGDSGNYHVSFNAPVGSRGIHPAVPFMGYAGKIWKKGEILIVDIAFLLEGYHTDKTQVYFAGKAREISDQVLRAQDFCAELQNWMAENLKPGVTPAELYNYCQRKAEEQGWGEGFMGLGGNKVPFVGHGIGLTVDEFPPVAGKFQQPLESGVVLALEPKIGLPGVGMVGVENTFLVSEVGGQCLTGCITDIICIE